MRKSSRRSRVCSGGYFVVDYGGIRRDGAIGGNNRVPWPDGAATLRICRRLARDAVACQRSTFRDRFVPHALQQSDCLYHGFLPEQVHGLLDRHPNLQAIKESSADIRRVSALRALAGQPLQILCGVDGAIVEAVYAGAVGWIAGLVNAFPLESVELFELASQGKKREAFELYRWFLPLLRLDVAPKFVQLVKLVQEEVGMGSQRVRPPRLTLSGQESEYTKRLVVDSLKGCPLLHTVAQ
jgi:hypothetical protein